MFNIVQKGQLPWTYSLLEGPKLLLLEPATQLLPGLAPSLCQAIHKTPHKIDTSEACVNKACEQYCGPFFNIGEKGQWLWTQSLLGGLKLPLTKHHTKLVPLKFV